MVFPVHDESDLQPGFHPWIVWLLLALNVCVFLYFFVVPAAVAQLLAFHFGLVPAFILQNTGDNGIIFLIPPTATLLTYAFIHGSWLHLAANMLFLWVFGDDVEMTLGHVRFIILYVVSGAAGGLAHLAANPASLSPLVGASAAVAGVVAAYLLLRPRARVTLLVFGIMTVTVRAYWIFALWLAWQIANVLVPMAVTEVAYWSHIGGFAAGLILIVLLRRTDDILPHWLGR